jgi:DNA-binding transcriptional LysR family regulator
MTTCLLISHAYRMEAQQLRTFVTVVRLGSFSAAGTALGYTQAAVSQQIAALEADLKTRLLTRRPVAPTEAGARLLEHAEPILLRLAAARSDVTRLTTTPAATLIIGVTPLAGAARSLTQALSGLRHQMPRLQITINTAPRQTLPTAVAQGEIDLALTDGLTAPGDPLSPPEQLPITAVGLTEEPVLVVIPASHPLASRQTLRLQDLADARWIAADNLAPSLTDISRHAGADGFKPALTYTGQDTRTLIHLAVTAHGLTLLPQSALTDPEITAIPIKTPRLCHRTELIHAALAPDSPASALAALLAQQ